MVEGSTEGLPGDRDLDFDLDFDLEWLFAGGVRLIELALDVPLFEADLPLRGLLEDILIVKVFLYPFLWFFVLFVLVGSSSEQLLLPAITILLCREPSLSQTLRHTWHKPYTWSRHTHTQKGDEREMRNRKVILVLVSW